MRKIIIGLILVAGVAAGVFWFTRADGSDTRSSANPGGAQRGPGGAGGTGGPGGGMGAMTRPPMTVEVARASRASVTESLLVVGNLIGAATVDVGSKVNGRLQTVNVRLGDSVRKGQILAVVEDQELREQVRQSEASFEVANATVRQREADLKFAATNLDRSRSLFERQLLPRQTLDDAEARHQAATAQLDLSRAQYEQARARLDELRITMANTRIPSPVDGFVGKRNLDPGAFVNANTSVMSVVDIRTVRLVVNLVEKDLRRIQVGAAAVAEVDAYPGEEFVGRVARLAPVLDPATRTAEMEVELPNPTFRLKPGMYARVRLTTGQRDNALVVPRNAVVDSENGRGVFLLDAEKRQAKFQPVEVGLQDDKQSEVVRGLRDGQTVITTGASALRDGDPVLLPGSGNPGGGARPSGNAGRPGGMSGQPGGSPVTPARPNGRAAAS